MLESIIIDDILEKENDLIVYCKTLANVDPLNGDDAKATIKKHISYLRPYELLQLCSERTISLDNTTLVTTLVQVINSGVVQDSYDYTSTTLKYVVEMLNVTVDLENLKNKIIAVANNEEAISSCFC